MPAYRRLFPLLAALTLALGGAVPAVATDGIGSIDAEVPMIEGVDVSVWQGAIDWPTVASAGKRFAYIRASSGNAKTDTRYGANVAAARAAGIVVGAYHFAYPTSARGDAVAEARRFLASASVKSGDLVPALDIEEIGDLTPAGLVRWVETFTDVVERRLGVTPVIYANLGYWRRHMGDTRRFAQAGHPLWLATWANAPRVPAGGWDGKGWAIWQYSNKGRVPGITSPRVDLDRMRPETFFALRVP